jgi:tetratricopeptide (TPR) repeat protein
MEKNRQRHYETANGLAMDVRRYLAGEPIVAAPPSTAYRLRKFTHRHRAGVVAAGFVAAALIVGFGAAMWQARIAARERDAARTAEAEARAVSEFQAAQLAGIDVAVMARDLRARILDEVKTGLERSGLPRTEVASRTKQLDDLLLNANLTNATRANLDGQILGRALRAADEQFRDQPLIKAKLLYSIASTMTTLGLFDHAVAPLQESLALRRRWLGDGDPDTLASYREFASVRAQLGAVTEAESLLREALAASRMRGADGPETFLLQYWLGYAVGAQGRIAEAEKEYRAAYEGLRRIASEDDIRTLRARAGLASILVSGGQLREAETHLRDVLDRSRRGDQQFADRALDDLSLVLKYLSKFADAETLLRDA